MNSLGAVTGRGVPHLFLLQMRKQSLLREETAWWSHTQSAGRLG